MLYLIFFQELFVQTTVQYLRKKAPQLLVSPPLSKDDINLKPWVNAETITVLLAVLQIALPSITNLDLIREIQTMLSTAKIFNSFLLTNEPPLARPTTIPLSLNSQSIFHHTPSPTNPSTGLAISGQLRPSFQSMNCRFSLENAMCVCVCCRGQS